MMREELSVPAAKEKLQQAFIEQERNTFLYRFRKASESAKGWEIFCTAAEELQIKIFHQVISKTLIRIYRELSNTSS